MPNLKSTAVYDFGNDPSYPLLQIQNKQLPEIEEWEVGREYRLVVTAKLRNKSNGEYGSYGSFSITGIKEDKDMYDECTDEQNKMKEMLT